MFVRSGEQFGIAAGDHEATIVEVGGAIREYRVAGRDVLDPFPIDAMSDGGHGAVLIPWPNRLEDGKYEFDGEQRQVDLSEPDKRNAIHGLLRWRSWRAAEREEHRVLMAATLMPMPGYPNRLECSVEYALDADAGLTVTTTIENAGGGPCPAGTGQHPYLSAGQGAKVDDCEVRLRAATRIDTDDERQLPKGRVPVAGSEYDFNEPRRIGALEVDYAYCDLERDGDGRAWTTLRGPDGATAGLWVDESYPYVELYTGDTLAPDRRRLALGCEPMSCPPNALRSGIDVARLGPGERLLCRWGATLR
jgi:aldose 1-epimerase